MARVVYVPELDRAFSFNDNASNDQISQYIRSNFKLPAQEVAEEPVAAPEEAPDESGIFGRAATGFLTSLTDIPGGIASIYHPAERAEKTAAGQLSRVARETIESTFGIDRSKPATTAQEAAEMVGGLAGLIVPSTAAAKVAQVARAAPRVAARIGAVLGAGQSAAISAQQRSDIIRQQLESGMQITPEQQLTAQRLDAVVGLSEFAPLSRVLRPISTLLSKVPASKIKLVEQILENRLGRVVKTGAIEGAQEAAQNVASDLVEYGVYNPNISVGEDIVSNAAMGAFGGSLVESVIQVAAGRKMRPYRQLQKDLADEGRQNAVAARQGKISRAAEELRRFNVDGPVEIQEGEVDNTPLFQIKTKAGNFIGDFTDREAATEAVDLYQKRTGAKVAVTEPFKAPAVFPVKIGNKTFSTMDEVVAARDAIKGEQDSILNSITDRAVVEQAARDEGVAPDFYKKNMKMRAESIGKKAKPFDEFIKAAAPKKDLSSLPGLVSIPYTSKSMFDVSNTPDAGESQIIDYVDGRKMVVKSVNGVNVPFYLSSGRAGKNKVPAGKWYPFFGVGPTDGWINKGSQEQMVAHYGSTELKAAAEELDATIGDIRNDDSIVKVGLEGEHVNFLNQGFDPANNAQPDSAEKIGANVRSTIERIQKAKTEQAATPDAEIVQEPAVAQEEVVGRAEEAAVEAPEAVIEAPEAPPPEQLSAGPLPEVAPTPKTVRQVTAEVTAPRDYTPEQKAFDERVFTGLKSRLSTLNLPGIEPVLREMIDKKPGYLVRGFVDAQGTPNDMKIILELSKGILDPRLTVEQNIEALTEVMNHEIIHIVRRMGLFRPAEWNILSKAVKNTKVPGKSYTYLDKAEAVYIPMGGDYADPDAVVEEAVAEMYKDWVSGKSKPVQNTTGLFNRLREFFRRIFGVLKSNAQEQVFKRIEAGEVGAREASPITAGEKFSAGPLSAGSPLSRNLDDRSNRAFDLYPYLRTSAARYYDHAPKITATTTPQNAARQIANLDQLLRDHPNVLANDAAWADYVADAMGKAATASTGVPIAPYKAVDFANNPRLIADQLGRMTSGQLNMAESGLSAAKDFEQAYRNGTATPIHTAKLILWGILSRGVSPFVQESMFLDVVKPVGISNRTGKPSGGIDQFIQDAIDGQFDLDAYKDYVKTLKIDGLPGAGTTHNLGAFGETTLVKLQQRVPDGRTLLQYLHDMIQDYSLSGKEIRRRFHQVNPGIGINNKVLSFILLVTGRDDVMVLDRVQMRNQFNDGMFDDYNLYDGVKIPKQVRSKDGTVKTKNVTDAGSGIAHLGDGIRGLMYYEALERDLTPAVRQAYAMLNRGNQFSMGRYHWESWVATSAQEVDHGSISGLLKDATGEVDPYRDVHTGEGKYNTYNSGMVYGYTDYGEAYVGLPDGLGRHYYFTPDYAKKVVEGYEKRSTGIIKTPIFKVSESVEGPWYERPEVDKQKLRDYLWAKSEEFKAERGRAFRERVQEASKANAAGSGPGPVNAIRRLGGVRQPLVTDAKSIADKYIGRDGTARFSASPLPGTEEFNAWFRKSAVVNRDGSPRVMYHGTDAKTIFKSFNPNISEFGTHFGTISQANQFATIGGRDIRRGGRVIPVYLSIQNPLRLSDKGNWNNQTVGAQLYQKGLITRDLFEQSQDDPFEDSIRIELRNAITSAGYDGIVYLNRVEGLNKGSIISLEDSGIDSFDITDQQFKGYIPESEDSYIILDPRQAKSVFNEFLPGERLRRSFSAAPLPPYVAQKNSTLFAPEVETPLYQRIFGNFLNANAQAKTLTNINGITHDMKWWDSFSVANRAAMVDDTAYVTYLEKIMNKQTTGNFERMTADYSATAALAWKRRSTQLNAAMIRRGFLDVNFLRPGDIQSATVKVVDSNDSLLNVIKVLSEPGEVDPTTGKQKDKREIFKSYAAAMRGRGLKAAGETVPRELDDTYINTTIPFVQQNYPEIVEAYKMYQRFNKNLLDSARKAQLITDDEFARLTRKMDYYSFYHEVFEEAVVPGISSKTASKFNLRPYTGSQYGNLMGDPVFVMIHNAQFWVDAITKNIAANKAFEVARYMNEARILQTGEEPDQSRGESKQVMFMRQNGIQKRFAVKDPMLVLALGSDDRSDVGAFMKFLGMPTQWLRESVTRDPGFIFANLARDTLSAWITSGEDITPFISTAKGMANALKKGSSFQALMGRGVVGSYDLAMLPPAELASKIRKIAAPKNVHFVPNAEAAMSVTAAIWDRMGNLSEASDAATRIAIYESALKQGLTEAEAAFRAIEVLDFSRRGGNQVVAVLTKLIPFLNARIQGLDVLWQAGKAAGKVVAGKETGDRERNIGKSFLVRGGMLAVASMVLEMMNSDDEDYQQLDDYIKDGNLLIPLRGFGLKGQFLAIPKPFEAGILFSTFPQMLARHYLTDQDVSRREVTNLFFSSIGSTFGMTPIPQIGLPALEVLVNHDFYTGLPLISEGKSRLANQLQYNSNTSQLAFMLSGIPIVYDFSTGKFEGMSPIAIDNLISGYAGPLGTYMTEAVSASVELYNATTGGELGVVTGPRAVSELPVVRRFFVDAKQKNPKVVTQAYEQFRIVDEVNRSYNKLRKIGDAEAVKDYLDENRDILSYKKYVFKLVEGLNNLSAQQRRIEADPELSREEKFEALRKIRETRIKLASKVKEINDKLNR